MYMNFKEVIKVEDRFENMVYAMQTFHLVDSLENYQHDENYQYFCDILIKLYHEMIALDTIDKVVSDDE